MTKMRFGPKTATLAWTAFGIGSLLLASPAAAAISADEFNEVINKSKQVFGPIVAQHGAELIIEGFYDTTSDGAMATRSRDHKKWFIRMWGGLPKFPSATPDTVTLILCHELGHHLAGYPFYSHDSDEWAATEGQADYWATQACTRLLWKNDTAENALYAGITDTRCESSFTTVDDINLCKRAFRATELNAPYEGKSSGGRPAINKRDRSVTRELFVAHPGGQCRVDSMHMGLLCNVSFDFARIPGRNNPAGQNTISAEIEARSSSCFGNDVESAKSRPRCWFKESTSEQAPGDDPFEYGHVRSDLLSLNEIPNVLSELWAEEDNLPWLIN
jgi:hypothetical protein